MHLFCKCRLESRVLEPWTIGLLSATDLLGKDSTMKNDLKWNELDSEILTGLFKVGIPIFTLSIPTIFVFCLYATRLLIENDSTRLV